MFGSVGGDAGVVRRWITDANEGGAIGRQYVTGADLRLDGKGFSLNFPDYQVQTFEIDNVTL